MIPLPAGARPMTRIEIEPTAGAAWARQNGWGYRAALFAATALAPMAVTAIVTPDFARMASLRGAALSVWLLPVDPDAALRDLTCKITRR